MDLWGGGGDKSESDQKSNCNYATSVTTKARFRLAAWFCNSNLFHSFRVVFSTKGDFDFHTDCGWHQLSKDRQITLSLGIPRSIERPSSRGSERYVLRLMKRLDQAIWKSRSIIFRFAHPIKNGELCSILQKHVHIVSCSYCFYNQWNKPSSVSNSS